MNPKEEKTNLEVTNENNDSFISKEKDANYINKNTMDNKLDEKSKDIEDEYKFGWSTYSERTMEDLQ